VEEIALDAAALDPEALAAEAVDKALRSADPISLPPGAYSVILEEHAVSDMVRFVAFLGFSAREYLSGSSFVAGKLGQQVVGQNVTIWDDGHDTAGLPLPFDYEGVPRRRLALIEQGVAGAVAYDSYYAARAGQPNTGHALPPGNAFSGPIPLNLFMAPGESTLEEMIRSTKRGVYVTRFNYTRPVHPLKVIVTGMTRDGTWLIENGEITRPVKNLRFTQSYLDSLGSVRAGGRRTRLVGGMVPTRVPALAIEGFQFTGSTA
jgi:predicted Zn-dependent protease